MIPLTPRLDDIDFDALVELARARLPALAPEWTDYNIHDPGIMLVELMAWVADSQVYSLARNRVDERLAMARLLGVTPHGAIPAAGVVHATDPPPRLQRIVAGTRLTPQKAPAPRLETAHAADLAPVILSRIRTQGAGAGQDHTAANGRQGVTFAAFGDPPTPGAALRIELEPPLNAQLPDSVVLLALGFEVAAAPGLPAPTPGELGRLEARRAETGRALAIVHDGTAELQHSGVMILSVPPAAGATALTVLLRPRAPHALAPRIARIGVNALPVRQQTTFEALRFPATGRAGQVVAIAPPELFEGDQAASERTWRLVDGADTLAVRVTRGGAIDDWTPGSFDDARPDDRIYQSTERPDGSRIELRFGNGVNGAPPPIGETIELARLRLSCGEAGNVASAVRWDLAGSLVAFENTAPIAGGLDPQSPESLLFRVRERLRDERILATSERIREVVGALPGAFGIDRFEIEEGWERGRRAPATPATRTLIVTRRHAGETRAWLAAIARRLRPRLAIGERLLVEAPVYRPFGVRAEVVVLPGRSVEAVVAAVHRDLDERFGNRRSARPDWPLGRDVDATALGGWIRRVDGVRRVVSATLVEPDGEAGDRIAVGRGELPQLGACEIAATLGRARS